ncbi:hypothetical protein RJ55_01974 [Drechmeria coniospora]|nr:hypothetical protein RJ55_01974 [Drechmeria coniospora]
MTTARFRFSALLRVVTSLLAWPALCTGFFERGSLPGLNGRQSEHARTIVYENNKRQLGRQGCVAAMTAGLTESGLRNLANRAVPPSTHYPSDGLGSNKDSIGIFQQRASIYVDIGCDMDPACAASQFLRDMQAVDGWQTMDAARLCQTVQASRGLEAFGENVRAATALCEAATQPDVAGQHA